MAPALAVAWRWPLLGARVFDRIENWGSRLAAHKSASVILTGILVLLVRLSLSPILGIPVPRVHDEFANLLGADTFVHGRLANPPHSMWVYFETFHVNQLPTYMSKYPPAQAAVLALGQVLGHPWIGVLLSGACLCGAITWMLQGWVTLRWALLGGVLAVAQFGATNYWMESYWGGAVTAIGGTLVLGAFPRIIRYRRPRDAAVFALGIGILANSRPYEGLAFCVPVVAALAWALLRKRPTDARSMILNVAAPMVGVLAGVFTFIAYYNWRGTGNPLLLPYMVNDHTYWSSPSFQWGTLRPPLQYRNPQLATFYNALRAGWLTDHWQWSWTAIKRGFLEKMVLLQTFYAPSQIGLPIFVSLFAASRNRKVRFFVAICAWLIVAALLVLWFLPHYVAPVTSAICALAVFGFRYIRHWHWKGRSVGIGVARALVLFHLALVPIQAATFHIVHSKGYGNFALPAARAQFQARLESLPGDHLVIVRYNEDHDVHKAEWVYNRADIDHAKVVWAREIPGVDISPLLNYFRGRTLWLAEPDAIPPRLSRYPGLPANDVVPVNNRLGAKD